MRQLQKTFTVFLHRTASGQRLPLRTLLLMPPMPCRDTQPGMLVAGLHDISSGGHGASPGGHGVSSGDTAQLTTSPRIPQLRRLGATLCITISLCLGACAENTDTSTAQEPKQPVAEQQQQQWQWQLQTAQSGDRQTAERFVQLLAEMSDKRLSISLTADTAPATDVFDAVAEGALQIGHVGSDYSAGKSPAFAFFAPLPFGMTQQEFNAWLYYGEGGKLLEQLHAPYGILPLPGGSIGIGLGGWFREKITGPGDLQGMRIEASGLAAKIYERLGSRIVKPAQDTMHRQLRNGRLDAITSIGLAQGVRLKLHSQPGYGYYPGWQAPGATLLFLIHQPSFNALTKDLQAMILTVAAAVNQELLERDLRENAEALQELRRTGRTQLLPFPEPVLRTLHQSARQTIGELATRDPQTQKIYDSYQKFFDRVRVWHETSDLSTMQLRKE